MAGDDNIYAGIWTEITGLFEDHPGRFIIGACVLLLTVMSAVSLWVFS